jgi:hypothetical protein
LVAITIAILPFAHPPAKRRDGSIATEMRCPASSALHPIADVPCVPANDALCQEPTFGTLQACGVLIQRDPKIERVDRHHLDGSSEGKADKAAGKVQNAIGGLKDTVRGK